MFPINEPDRHWGCRINDQITWHGMRALLIQNELLQIVVLVDKGTEIIQFLYKPLDIDFLWHGTNPLRNPALVVPAGGSQATPFQDFWAGGWFETAPNGGPACEYKGAPLGFFAETNNVPWEYRILEDCAERVSVALWIRTSRTPFLLRKTLTLETGKPALYIEEELTNLSDEPMDAMWGHHPVVGAPFLDESCRISAPACQVEVRHAEDGPDNRMGLHQKGPWPIITDREGNPLDLRQVEPASARTMDNCYLSEFNEGWVAVSNPRQNVGFGMAWDPNVFRYVWMWEPFGGGIGYPWFGRIYALALEPWSSYPCEGLQEAIARSTQLQLQPRESLKSWLTAVAFTGHDDVQRIARDGSVE